MDIKQSVIDAAEYLDSKKAENVIVIQVDQLTPLTDYFIIAGGDVQINIQSLSDQLQSYLKDKGLLPVNHSRGEQAGWILLDYRDFVIHLMLNEKREFYNLERMWGDGAIVWKGTEG